MSNYTYEGKSLEDALTKASIDLNLLTTDIIITKVEEHQGIIKKNVTIEVTTINDLIDKIKETLTTITNLMNIKINLEVKRRDKNIDVKIFSDNNSILIGANGRTLSSLQNVLRQIVLKDINDDYHINLDVENYKEKKIRNLERLAKKLAKEVVDTQAEIKLDSMNSYERRVVHNALANNPKVKTESIGEEPNRSVVIKPV